MFQSTLHTLVTDIIYKHAPYFAEYVRILYITPLCKIHTPETEPSCTLLLIYRKYNTNIRVGRQPQHRTDNSEMFTKHNTNRTG